MQQQSQQQQQSHPLKPSPTLSSSPPRIHVSSSASSSRLHNTTTPPSLVSLCRLTIVAHLERYPPHAFAICGPDEFDELIRLRHDKTAPHKGTGGIDGTGRLAPAVAEKWLRDVEEVNEHLTDSVVTDELVWKDCVEFRFKRGGLTRPRALCFPWPILVEHLQDAANIILQATSLQTPDAQLNEACKTLMEAPMDVDLLQATGVGKILKKALKKNQQYERSEIYGQLDQLLNVWKDLAATNGVTIKDAPTPAGTKNSTSLPSSHATKQSYLDDAPDLQLLRSCDSWRLLFRLLKEREELRRSNQGKRMREIRKHLASDRPKVVKVRPAYAKHNKLGNGHAAAAPGRGGWGQATTPVGKIDLLRKETSIMSARQKCTPAQALKTPTSSSFGAAVAFATVSKGKSSSTRNKTVQLNGGKQMKIPSKVVQGSGGQPRQLAAKWKPR